MKPVRWGILSTAVIGTQKVIPGMVKSTAVEVVAIASRTLPNAEKAAAELGLEKAYGSYEELLADPTIEAIYNPLPNHLHVPMTLAAVQAGKHVLCEKPISLTAVELEVLRPYASKVHIREAVMVHFQPQWIDIREHIRNGVIGDLRSIHVMFSYFNDSASDIRNVPEFGGGALYDIGCYAIFAGRWFHEREPERVIASIERDPVHTTDRLTSGLLDFGSGRQLAFTVSTQAASFQRIQLIGTKGSIEIEIPFNAPTDAPCRYSIDAPGAFSEGRRREFSTPIVDQYQLQAEAFSHAIRTQQPTAVALDDAAANMRIIDALFASEKSGTFVQP